MINLLSMKGIFHTRQGTIILHTIIWSLLLLFPYFFATAKTGYLVDGIPVSFITITSLINIALFYIHAYFIYPSFLNRRQCWLYLSPTSILFIAPLLLQL